MAKKETNLLQSSNSSKKQMTLVFRRLDTTTSGTISSDATSTNAAGAMRSTAMFYSSNAVFGSTGGMHPTATSVISVGCINLCRHNWLSSLWKECSRYLRRHHLVYHFLLPLVFRVLSYCPTTNLLLPKLMLSNLTTPSGYLLPSTCYLKILFGNFGLPRPPFTKKIPKLQKIINCISYLCRIVGKRPSHTKQLKPRFARGSSWVWTNNSSGVYSEARQPLLNSHRKFSQVVCIKPM